jgi:competence protein ComGC
MSIDLRIEKRGKAIVELIIVIVFLFLLMITFISHFMTQKEHISEAGFNRIANVFFSQVNVIRSQWLMDRKPKKVRLSVMGKEQKLLMSVNQWGWLDVEDKILVCDKIWQLAVDMPMEFMKSPVSAVQLKTDVEQQGHVCRYGINSGQYFEYRSATGQVTQYTIDK